MSPGLRWPRSECTSTPSHTSIATLARYSCERCIGFRVWNAATRDQPRRWNSARVSAPVIAPHEALERREAADAEHHEIALLARGDAHLRQALRAPVLLRELLARDLQGPQATPPVRRYQGGHGGRYATNGSSIRAT